MAIREVIFRGKRADNGEWVEGDVLQTRYHSGHIEYQIMPQTPVSSAYPVLPETVGQYTGLTDKNGVKIFEGDIIRIEYDLWHGETKKTRESHIGVVFYNTKTAEFGAKIHGYSSCSSLRRWKGDFNEVIGNIHDNPELLEGGRDNG